MKQGRHGGNIYEAANHLAVDISEIHDYSSNVSPWAADLSGMDVTKQLSVLPEPHSHQLKSSIANAYGVNIENICVTSGTTEAIDKICLLHSGGDAVIFEPTYSDYFHYASMYSMKIIQAVTGVSEGFKGALQSVKFPAGLCFICNPNNPTGKIVQAELIIDAAEKNPQTLFIVDESYMPFHTRESEFSLVGVDMANIAVLRSFSKIYGLPGLRLGAIVCSDEKLIDKIEKKISPWSVNTLAQAAGEVLIKADTTETAKRLESIKNDFLNKVFKYKWAEAIPSDVNYMLIRLAGIDSASFFKHCLIKKVLIRDCSNFFSLDSSYIRVAVREDMNPLIECFDDFEL
jgi:threonine-phosphate decarboxylase